MVASGRPGDDTNSKRSSTALVFSTTKPLEATVSQFAMVETYTPTNARPPFSVNLAELTVIDDLKGSSSASVQSAHKQERRQTIDGKTVRLKFNETQPDPHDPNRQVPTKRGQMSTLLEFFCYQISKIIVPQYVPNAAIVYDVAGANGKRVALLTEEIDFVAYNHKDEVGKPTILHKLKREHFHIECLEKKHNDETLALINTQIELLLKTFIPNLELIEAEHIAKKPAKWTGTSLPLIGSWITSLGHSYNGSGSTKQPTAEQTQNALRELNTKLNNPALRNDSAAIKGLKSFLTTNLQILKNRYTYKHTTTTALPPEAKDYVDNEKTKLEELNNAYEHLLDLIYSLDKEPLSIAELDAFHEIVLAEGVNLRYIDDADIFTKTINGKEIRLPAKDLKHYAIQKGCAVSMMMHCLLDDTDLHANNLDIMGGVIDLDKALHKIMRTLYDQYLIERSSAIGTSLKITKYNLENFPNFEKPRTGYFPSQQFTGQKPINAAANGMKAMYALARAADPHAKDASINRHWYSADDAALFRELNQCEPFLYNVYKVAFWFYLVADLITPAATILIADAENYPIGHENLFLGCVKELKSNASDLEKELPHVPAFRRFMREDGKAWAQQIKTNLSAAAERCPELAAAIAKVAEALDAKFGKFIAVVEECAKQEMEKIMVDASMMGAVTASHYAQKPVM